METQRPVVLITGASGFIGSALVRRLSDQYTVVALDRAGSPKSAHAQSVAFDLKSDESVRVALDEVGRRFGRHIASVVHLAAYYDIMGEPNPLYEQITVQGTRRLIDGLQSFEVEQFIYASSMLVHAPTDGPDQLINEDSPIGPTWAYPQSKVDTEALLRKRHGAIPLVLLRIAGVYDDSGHNPFIAEQIARIYEHRLLSHVYPGMLCAGQSFLHVEDLADAVARLVEHREWLPCELPLLVGEPVALGYEEIQDIVGEALHGHDWTTSRARDHLARAPKRRKNPLAQTTTRRGACRQDRAMRRSTFHPWAAPLRRTPRNTPLARHGDIPPRSATADAWVWDGATRSRAATSR